MSLEVQIPPSAVGDVGVQLCGGEVGVPEHLLDAAEVGPAFEQVRREGVPEKVRMDALGLELGFGGEAAQDQERAGPREWAALGVQKELRPVPTVEVRATAREVAA